MAEQALQRPLVGLVDQTEKPCRGVLLMIAPLQRPLVGLVDQTYVPSSNMKRRRIITTPAGRLGRSDVTSPSMVDVSIVLQRPLVGLVDQTTAGSLKTATPSTNYNARWSAW